ncbi:MAG: serine hydrolase domain-containing protein [Chryseolinea sp.]
MSLKIDSLIQTVPDFSGVILLADHGVIKYHRAFGFRNRERQVALDTLDIFELASVSKQFTSMIIMMLQEAGRLQFDDSLSTYIKGLPYNGITIRNLLTHTSGLPDYQAVMDEHWDKSKVAGNEDNIAYLIKYKPSILFKPGDRYKYSNTGYMLLASIAEKTSGDDFIELCRKRIFSKLKMKSTDIRTRVEKQSIENFALGYIYESGKERYVTADSFPEFNYAIWLGNRKGPGRISSTSNDLLLWDRALYTEDLIRKKTLDIAYTPMTLNNDSISNYGFGWNITTDSLLGKVVSHTGDNPGYKTEIVRYIDRDKTIIFLNNNAHPKKAEIMAEIRKIVSRN